MDMEDNRTMSRLGYLSSCIRVAEVRLYTVYRSGRDSKLGVVVVIVVQKSCNVIEDPLLMSAVLVNLLLLILIIYL